MRIDSHDPVQGLLFILLSALALQFLLLLGYRRLQSRAGAGAWATALFAALPPPLSLMLWLSVLVIVLRRSALELPPWFPEAVQLTFLALGVWLLLRCAQQVSRRLDRNLEDQRNARMAVHLALRIFQILVLASAALLALQLLGYPTSGLLTLGGVGGLVLGIAFRDILANFFAGLVLFLEAPFRVGDTVSVQGGAHLGEILRIGWRSTEILTRERRRLHIPNNLLVTEVVENISVTDRRRIRETFGVRYQDLSALPALIEELRRVLREHPDLDQEHAQLAVFDAFGDSSLNIMIDALARTGEWRRYKQVRHDLFLRIAEAVHGCGADFAFPTRTLHIEPAGEETAATETAKRAPPAGAD